MGTAGAGLRGQQVLHNAVGMSFWSISPREPNTSKSPTMSHCLWQERGIRSLPCLFAQETLSAERSGRSRTVPCVMSPMAWLKGQVAQLGRGRRARK